MIIQKEGSMVLYLEGVQVSSELSRSRELQHTSDTLNDRCRISSTNEVFASLGEAL